MDLAERIAVEFPYERGEMSALAQCDATAFARALDRCPGHLWLLGQVVRDGFLWPVERLLAETPRRPRQVLQTLGYPRWLHRPLLRCHRPGVLLEDHFDLLCATLRKPALRRLFSHLPAITEETLLLGHRMPEICLRDPGLLSLSAIASTEDGPADDEDWGNGSLFATVDAIISMRRLLGEKAAWPYRSERLGRGGLENVRLRMETMLARTGRAPVVAYPPGPCDEMPVLERVGSAEDLMYVAKEFRNCVVAYHSRLFAGLASLYVLRASGLPPCCVMLRRVSGRWELQEIGIADNLPPPPELEVRVGALLEEVLPAQPGGCA